MVTLQPGLAKLCIYCHETHQDDGSIKRTTGMLMWYQVWLS